MSDTKLLIGSLSNDLYRAATLMQRQSLKGAQRFIDEAQRWGWQLQGHEVKDYIKKILDDVIDQRDADMESLDLAEKYLMYSILLQNYALHLKV